MNYFHAFFGWLMACLMVYDMTEIIIVSDKHKYSDTHKKFGWSMMFAVSGWTVSGVIAFMARKLLKWDTKTIQYLRYTHRIIAITFWCISMYAMYTGMMLYLTSWATYQTYKDWIWFLDFSFST